METVPMAEDGHRAFVITDTDKRGNIVIAATILMSWMTLCFFTRVYVRLDINGPLGLDDFLAGLGSVFGIVHVGVLLGAVNQGLGESLNSLRLDQVNAAEKGLYICDIFFILGHCCAKLSVAFFLRRLGRDALYKRACMAAALVIGIWGVTSTLAICIRCNISHPWLLDDHCTGVKVRWQAVTAFDVITEVILVGITCYLVWGLHMSRGRKVIVVFAFGCRLLAAANSIVRQIFINNSINSQDPTLAAVNPVLCTEVLLHYSLMAATIPCLKPFVIAFDTGWGQSTPSKRNSYLHHSSDRSANTGSQEPSAKRNKRTSSSPRFFKLDDHDIDNMAGTSHDANKTRGGDTVVNVIAMGHSVWPSKR